MLHCTKCGVEVPANAQFCPNCGQAQPATPVQPAWQPPATGPGMSENTAATLSYVLGWFTGIIFFLIDKRPYVRFHAAQSIVTFGGLNIIRVVLALVFGVGFSFHGGSRHWGYGTMGGFGVGLVLISLLGLLTFILWIACMVKAAQGSRFMLPIAGEIAENLAGR
jgi:uncharacterized membrane protein